MKISRKPIESKGFRFSLEIDGKEIGRASLFLIKNDPHPRPYGLLEDLYVEGECRARGLGSKLVYEIVSLARELGCYKLLATSRHSRKELHHFYQRLGFINHGLEFRMDL